MKKIDRKLIKVSKRMDELREMMWGVRPIYLKTWFEVELMYYWGQEQKKYYKQHDPFGVSIKDLVASQEEAKTILLNLAIKKDNRGKI